MKTHDARAEAGARGPAAAEASRHAMQGDRPALDDSAASHPGIGQSPRMQAQRLTLQAAIGSSPRSPHEGRPGSIAEDSPREALQRQQVRTLFGPTRKPTPLQRRGVPATAPDEPRSHEASAVVQRVKTPVPRTFHWYSPDGGVEDRGKFFRAYLETLRWQLIQVKAQQSPEMVALNKLLARDDNALAEAQDEVVSLIQRAPAPNTPSTYETPVLQPLDAGQQRQFSTMVDTALRLIAATRSNQQVLEAIFGPAQVAEAAAGFGRIALNLQRWNSSVGQPGEADKVRFNKSNAHYAALCLGAGKGDAARLGLSNKAFTGDAASLVATLIHEGSHAALNTADLAYIGNSAFARLTGLPLSLRNADHYKLAADIQAGKAVLPQPAAQAQGDGLAVIGDAFQRGVDLCAYKCGKVKRLMNYSIPVYQQQSVLHDAALLGVHERYMDLGGKARGASHPAARPDNTPYEATTLSAIAAARSESFAFALGIVDGYISAERDIVIHGDEVTCTLRSGGGKTITYALGDARNAVAIARILFVTTLDACGIGPAVSAHLFDWHDALWGKLLTLDNKAQTYNQTDDEMQMVEMLQREPPAAANDPLGAAAAAAPPEGSLALL